MATKIDSSSDDDGDDSQSLTPPQTPAATLTSSKQNGEDENTQSEGAQPQPVEDENVFEVDKIVGHKITKGKYLWRIRWIGYGPKDDTWEPRENLLNDKVVKMLNDYEEKRRAKVAKLASRKRHEQSTSQQSSVKQRKEAQTEKDEEGEAGDEVNESTSWFGITSNEDNREKRNLFVTDRRLSKTEKILTEIGTLPTGGPILRSHLKEQAGSQLGAPEAPPLTMTVKTRSSQNQNSSDMFIAEFSPQPKAPEEGTAVVLKPADENRMMTDQQQLQQEFEEIVMDGKVEHVRIMLSTNVGRLNLNHTDEFGKTLIHKLCEIKCAMSHTQCELIDLLVSKGARLDVREFNNDQIPLHIAIANRRLCQMRKLLQFQSPINAKDKNGKSPLILALDCSESEFIKCLLKAGASFQTAQEKLKHQLRCVSDHESQLQNALNLARDKVTKLNMSFECISPIFVSPFRVREVKPVIHTFQLSNQPQLLSCNHVYMLIVGVAEFSTDESDATCSARLWGQSAVQCVFMNGRECQEMKAGKKFAFSCVPCQGKNQIELRPEADHCDSHQRMLLAQVMLTKLFR